MEQRKKAVIGRKLGLVRGERRPRQAEFLHLSSHDTGQQITFAIQCPVKPGAHTSSSCDAFGNKAAWSLGVEAPQYHALLGGNEPTLLATLNGWLCCRVAE
uniref:Uncharacterized protein n=1 Tax=Knipowitschia caucasica TaxID=637954 RepID=A0AAV2K9V9_KNICA